MIGVQPYDLTLPANTGDTAKAVKYPAYDVRVELFSEYDSASPRILACLTGFHLLLLHTIHSTPQLPKAVLITGGCGFLGRHLVDALLTQGGATDRKYVRCFLHWVFNLDMHSTLFFFFHERRRSSNASMSWHSKNARLVRPCASRNTRSPTDCVKRIVVFDIVEGKFVDPSGRVTVVKGDLVKGSSLADAIKAHGVTTVFHVASPHPNGSNRALFYDVNVTGTASVIKACMDTGVRTLVYTSSASVVWQGAAQEGVDESIPYPSVFRDYYAETKATAEKLVMEAGTAARATSGPLITISLRPHAIWGPRDPQMVGTTVTVAKAGRMRGIVGDGTNVVDWTYVGNVVHAHMLAAAAGHRAAGGNGLKGGACAASGRTYFVTNGEPMPFWSFMNAMVLAFGYDTSTFRMPMAPLVAIASAVASVISVINACRPPSKQIQLTFSAPRLLIAGTAHWYSIVAARRDLGYAPLWSVAQGLYLTVKAFPELRNPKPSAATLEKARRGNLVALGLVADPEAAAAARPGGAVLGANEAFRNEATLPLYTRAEVAKHCSAEDAWVIIDGLVHDVTRYVESHPGGVDEILQHVGGDASKGFHGEQHPAHVFETVKKFLVGRVAEEEGGGGGAVSAAAAKKARVE